MISVDSARIINGYPSFSLSSLVLHFSKLCAMSLIFLLEFDLSNKKEHTVFIVVQTNEFKYDGFISPSIFHEISMKSLHFKHQSQPTLCPFFHHFNSSGWYYSSLQSKLTMCLYISALTIEEMVKKSCKKVLLTLKRIFP